MYNVSAAFLNAVRSSHTLIVQAEFWYGGVKRATVPIIGGDLTIDRTAAIRRSGSFQFSGAQKELVLPAVNDYFTSPLWPIGNELRVSAGIELNNKTTELVPVGVYRISKPRLHHAEGDVSISVDGYDRSRAVSRARFSDSYVIASGSDYSTELKKLLKDRLPGLLESDFVQWMVTDGSDDGPVYVTPQLVFVPQDDPWSKALEMARSFGAEIFFDGSGLPVLRPQPDPAFSPSVFDYVAGEDATFTTIDRELDDDQAYNGLIVTGKSNDNSVSIPRAEAWDTNPSSPTYYDPDRPDDSKYGPVPAFYSSDYITTNAQAQATAQTELLRYLGIIENVSFSGIGNPAHDGSDVVKVQDLDVGVDGMYILDSVRLNLGEGGGMSGQTRKRRTV